jgi:hypothetical protein
VKFIFKKGKQINHLRGLRDVKGQRGERGSRGVREFWENDYFKMRATGQ